MLSWFFWSREQMREQAKAMARTRDDARYFVGFGPCQRPGCHFSNHLCPEHYCVDCCVKYHPHAHPRTAPRMGLLPTPTLPELLVPIAGDPTCPKCRRPPRDLPCGQHRPRSKESTEPLAPPVLGTLTPVDTPDWPSWEFNNFMR